MLEKAASLLKQDRLFDKINDVKNFNRYYKSN